MVWEGSLKSHFERNIDFLDFELDFGGLLDLEMVPKVIYGLHWGSQGCPLGVLGAGLDVIYVDDIQGNSLKILSGRHRAELKRRFPS